MTFQSRLIDPTGDAPPKMSVEAFFRWAETRDRKFELVNGVPSLQPWVKRSHSLIAGNVSFALQTQLDRAVYAVHQGDFAVATGPESIRYADVLVEPLGDALDGRLADAAVVLIEILSPSTAHIDFGPKAREYMALPLLTTYLIIDQERRYAWRWSRDAEGDWPGSPDLFDEPDAAVAIPGIGAELRFEDIYRNVR